MGEGVRGEEAQVEELAERLYKELVSDVLPRLSRVRDETRRYLLFTAWLNTRLEFIGLGRLIITGGFAVEVYTGRVYRTMDVDVIVEGLKASKVVERLLSLFSERIGRGYLPRFTELAVKSIDVVANVYAKRAKPVKLEVDGLHVYLEPPEELIVSYLVGWKHWGSTEDRDKALWLYIVWRDKLDMNYLTERAREEHVEDALRELETLIQRAANSIP